jgi:hypothetical protein
MDDHRKNYRAWDAQQNSHDPISPRDALPEDDLVFFLLDLIPQIDLTPFHQYYAQEMRGQPPYDVTMMVSNFSKSPGKFACQLVESGHAIIPARDSFRRRHTPRAAVD